MSPWNWQLMETFYGGGCYDGGILEISTDGGTTWTQVPDASLPSLPQVGHQLPPRRDGQAHHPGRKPDLAENCPLDRRPAPDMMKV